MKTNFRSRFTSSVFAAGALGFAVLSAPAHADLRWNGPLLQGISLQGISLNGPVLQGISLNGPILQGIQANGVRLNGPVFQGRQTTGAQTGRIVAVSLPSGEVIDLR